MLVEDTQRVSDIGRHMEGTFHGGGKTVERLLQLSDPKESLQMLFEDDASLSSAMSLRYRRRTFPFHFVCYSSATLGEVAGSGNGGIAA
jgi:hypothetical protein